MVLVESPGNAKIGCSSGILLFWLRGCIKRCAYLGTPFITQGEK